ncbi:MAG: hypothetical protein AB7I52_05410 [Rhizobiaceae bacterium]
MNADNDNKPEADGPALAEQDWDAIATGELTPSSAPENGDLRYEDGSVRKSGELDGENDDNPEQESDEALPNDREERTLRRDPGRERNPV